MTSSLARSAARGAFFTFAAQMAKIVLQLLSVIVLSRLLTPHDYGLLAIVLVMVGAGEILRDFGLTSASIQAPTLSRGQRDNLFWINTGIGAALTVVMFALSWTVAAILNEPDLIGIVQWLSLIFLLNGLATQHRANLMRDLKFRAVAVIDVGAASIALLAAIVAALLGAGYFSLVIQQLLGGGVTLVGSVIAGGWLPRWYSRKHGIGGIVSFGWNIVATNLLVYGGSQVDTVLVGFKFGTSSLGLYNRAYQLIMTTLGQVRGPMKNVAVPVLSRVQEDPPRFNTYVTSAQLALGYTLGIPLVLAAGLADPLVHIMLGPQWGGAVPIVRCFAIAGLLNTLAFVGYWVYLSRGLGRQLFLYTIVTTVIKVACIVTGSFFGLLGVAVAFAIAPAISWPLSLFWLSRVTPMPTRRLYEGAGRIVVFGVAGGGAAFASSLLAAGWGWWGMLIAGLLAGAAVTGAALLVPAYRKDASKITAFVRLMLPRSSRPGVASS